MPERQIIQKAKRIVIKIGSRVLVQRSGRPDTRRMRELADQISELRANGLEVILVSSGAVGAGMEALNMKTRPKAIPDLQMAAAVGQSRLMAAYDELFGRRGIRIGQILLTHDDLKHRARHLNARNTMLNLLRHNIVPIVNENDVVAIDEIRFGDNDLLASLVAIMMDADLMILLTTVDGFRIPAGKDGRTKRASVLRELDDALLRHATGKGGELSTGGMASKLKSAAMAVSTGIPVVIANGRARNILPSVIDGKNTGTLLLPPHMEAGEEIPHRKRWIAFFHRSRGSLVIDDGARTALVDKGRSLLPIGVREVEGEFEKGSVVNVLDTSRQLVARGLSAYNSRDMRMIQGHKSADIKTMLGACVYDEVIHRDNMVILTPRPPKS
ncbi:MAG: glutamate 5-kinase [Verrucomicrobia bacterium]|nr:glutamate 5-kinase [Kiritimatiellia bacterium]MCP5487555.1 glutamate 5-kinase [Verrucomicrobiota bacterium]